MPITRKPSVLNRHRSTNVGPRAPLTWLTLLSTSLGTNSVTARPIYERWRRAYPDAPVSDFEPFLRLHGTPLPTLARHLNCDVKRMRAMWKWYGPRHFPQRSPSWLDGYLPLDVRTGFVETAIRALERIPSPPKPPRLKPLAPLIKSRDARPGDQYPHPSTQPSAAHAEPIADAFEPTVNGVPISQAELLDFRVPKYHGDT